jgi:hypothetical protein
MMLTALANVLTHPSVPATTLDNVLPMAVERSADLVRPITNAQAGPSALTMTLKLVSLVISSPSAIVIKAADRSATWPQVPSLKPAPPGKAAAEMMRFKHCSTSSWVQLLAAPAAVSATKNGLRR